MSSSFACTRATVSAQAVADKGVAVTDDQRHPTPWLAALWTQFIAFVKLRRSMVSLRSLKPGCTLVRVRVCRTEQNQKV